jgi:hypothetical protein
MRTATDAPIFVTGELKLRFNLDLIAREFLV